MILAPDAATAYQRLSARARAEVRDAIEICLRHEPAKTSKSRIKRLRGLLRPQHRLRVGEIRVFYDVEGEQVRILAIVTKAQAQLWLSRKGVPHEDRGSGESER